jgi:hypothetical protein
MSADEKTRVDFNAPKSLVEQADQVADVLNISRTQLLVDALRDELEELTRDAGFQRTIKDAYYTGDLDFSTIESILGTEDAMRMKLLKEAVDRDPPEPKFDSHLPSNDAFYEGAVPEWTPNDEREESDGQP